MFLFGGRPRTWRSSSPALFSFAETSFWRENKRERERVARRGALDSVGPGGRRGWGCDPRACARILLPGPSFSRQRPLLRARSRSISRLFSFLRGRRRGRLPCPSFWFARATCRRRRRLLLRRRWSVWCLVRQREARATERRRAQGAHEVGVFWGGGEQGGGAPQNAPPLFFALRPLC